MINTIHRIKEFLKKSSAASTPLNETEIKIYVVLQILKALGWDIQTPSEVRFEFPIQQKATTHADVVVLNSRNEIFILFELKSQGKLKDAALKQARTQLFSYIGQNTPIIAVLTDGELWEFFYTWEGHGKPVNKRFGEINNFCNTDDKSLFDIFNHLNKIYFNDNLRQSYAIKNLSKIIKKTKPPTQNKLSTISNNNFKFPQKLPNKNCLYDKNENIYFIQKFKNDKNKHSYAFVKKINDNSWKVLKKSRCVLNYFNENIFRQHYNSIADIRNKILKDKTQTKKISADIFELLVDKEFKSASAAASFVFAAVNGDIFKNLQ